MATVYLAQDLRHDRPVALKVLHPELAASLGPERFLREIKLAARLQHPHILTVYDSGEIRPGRLWFTMPFVEGESLRDRLRRERQLPVEDAVRIAREAAEALRVRPRHGVVHRDIKPENILLTGTATRWWPTSGSPGRSGGRRRAADRDRPGGRDPGLHEPGAGRGRPGARRAGPTSTRSAACSTRCWRASRPSPAPTTQAMHRQALHRAAAEPCGRLRATRARAGGSGDPRRRWRRSPADRFATAAQFAQALQGRRERADGSSRSRHAAAAAVSAATARRQPAAVARRSAAVLVLGFLIGLGVLFAWRRSHGGAAADGGGTRVLAVLPFENLGDSVRRVLRRRR